jgi:hypothetical protein
MENNYNNYYNYYAGGQNNYGVLIKEKIQILKTKFYMISSL